MRSLFVFFALFVSLSSAFATTAECTDCQLIVTVVQDLLYQGLDSKEIINRVNLACQADDAPPATCKTLSTDVSAILDALKGYTTDPKAPAKVCAKISACQARVNPLAQVNNVEDDAVCSSCLGLFTVAEDWVEVNTDPTALLIRLQYVCTLAPETYSFACNTILTSQWNQALSMIKAKVSPNAACDRLQLCNGTAVPFNKNNSLICDGCSVVVSYIKRAIDNGDSYEKIATVVDNMFCKSIKSFEPACDAILSVGYEQFINYAKNMTPQTLCAWKISNCK